MYRKYFFVICAALGALLAITAPASAQVDRMRGQVMLKQADGTTVPVDKAVVEVFRTDRGGNKNTTTDKKGEFTLVLDVAGDYVLAVSAPNAQPQVLRAKVREELYKVTLDPGDGRRLTKDEVMAALKGTPIPSKGGGTSATGANAAAASAEASKQPRPDEAKNAEAKRKVEATNETVSRTFKAGNEALKAKRYDEAITQYDEGLAADPEQAALWTNKSEALRQRGSQRYREAKDDAARDVAKKDFTDAVEAAKKAVDLAKAEKATDAASQNQHNIRTLLALFERAEGMRLFVTVVDKSQADAGIAAYDEYIAALTDPAKKLEEQLKAAKMLFEVGAADKAAAAYQKILAEHPDNADAALYIGLSLYSTGDSTKYQEAANWLQKFVEKAPDTHPMKASAKEVLDNLKQQNVQPQKTTGGRRRG